MCLGGAVKVVFCLDGAKSKVKLCSSETTSSEGLDSYSMRSDHE